MDPHTTTAFDPDRGGDGAVATMPRPVEAPRRPAGEETAAARRAAIRDLIRFSGPIVALVLGIKALVFTWGVIAREVLEDKTAGSFSDRFAFWNAWDAPHYLDIARNGYETTGDAANWIVFFPAYPYAVRFFDAITPGDLLASAFVVSGIASVAAAVLLGVLVRNDTGDDARAHRAVWFLLIFPTAYFLHIPYTESLFLSLVLGAFVAARTGHWRTAGIVGALAALTRINGIILIPALAVEAYVQYRKHGKLDRSWLWIAFIGVGTLVYLGINQHVFGNAFHFQDVQASEWHKNFQDPISSIQGMHDRLEAQTPALKQMLTQEFVFLAIGFAAAVLTFIYGRASYGVWVLLNMLLFASTSWIQSTPRYVLTLFPIFLLLAMIGKRVWLSRLISAWSLMWMAWFTALFALNSWAF